MAHKVGRAVSKLKLSDVGTGANLKKLGKGIGETAVDAGPMVGGLAGGAIGLFTGGIPGAIAGAQYGAGIGGTLGSMYSSGAGYTSEGGYSGGGGWGGGGCRHHRDRHGAQPQTNGRRRVPHRW